MDCTYVQSVLPISKSALSTLSKKRLMYLRLLNLGGRPGAIVAVACGTFRSAALPDPSPPLTGAWPPCYTLDGLLAGLNTPLVGLIDALV